MADVVAPPSIYVLAGTNGAGKSSIGGAMLRREGVEYFDPDEATRRIRTRNPGATELEANSAAWHQGRRLLERAIAERLSFAFETTLGGTTIPGLLERAAGAGIAVRIWYVGLRTPELHLARVRARVARGGHDVPEATIRDRYDRGRVNLVRLMPRLAELWLYDNSQEGDPAAGIAPRPRLLLHVVGGQIVTSCELGQTPEWAKPILAAALREPATRTRPRRRKRR